MKVTREEILKIARLANLCLESHELERFSTEFAAILEYFESLEKLDISGIRPTSHVSAGTSTGPDPYRADATRPGFATEEALREAPETGGGHFLVPKFIA